MAEAFGPGVEDVARIDRKHRRRTAKEDRELHIVRVVEGLSDLGSNPHWPQRRLEEIRESAVGLGVDRFRLRATVTQIREYLDGTRQAFDLPLEPWPML